MSYHFGWLFGHQPLDQTNRFCGARTAGRSRAGPIVHSADRPGSGPDRTIHKFITHHRVSLLKQTTFTTDDHPLGM